MATYGGNKYGGNKYGGKKYGGSKFGGNRYGSSMSEDVGPGTSESKPSPAPKPIRSFLSSAAAGESSRAKSVMGTKRTTGAGYTGAKGQDVVAPAKSAKMSAAVPKVSRKPSVGFKTTVTPAKKAAKSDDYNRREELGGFYLNATSGMFSPKAGGKKKK